MVTHWGMSDRLGPMSFRVGEEHVFLGKEIQEHAISARRPPPSSTRKCKKLLPEADEQAYVLLEANRDKLDRLVEELLVKEELQRRNRPDLRPETGTPRSNAG